MTQIIFSTKFNCKICRKKIDGYLYGESDFDLIRKEEKDAIDWMRHFHWIDYHRVCAICGRIVKSGNLELLINDGKTAIHKNYSDEYVKIKRGNKFGPLLIVHTDCLLKKQKVNKNE